MSLILEALRRSEAERRRAAPPSLLGDATTPRRPAASPWAIALAGLLLGVLLAAAAWWGFDAAQSTRADAATIAEPAPASASAPSSVPAPEAPIEPVPSAAYATVTETPRPAAPTATPKPAPRSPSAVPSAPLPVLGELSPAPNLAAPPTPAPANAPQASVESGLGPRDGDLRWSEGAFDGLPPLRVSMQVYADDPARRFAIIDGQRRHEGEALQPGLVLLEIRRDGLRLGWQERVLWVPR